MQVRPTFGVLSSQCLCHLSSVANTTEKLPETRLRKKKSKFLVYGITPSIQFSYMENVYHRVSYNFLYVWNCMKLYDKKFLI